MIALLALLTALAALAAGPAAAQQQSWIQVKAERTLREAEASARAYAARLSPVAGFRMRSGWYAIALGPFSRPEAERTLRQLRITRQIPADSYLTDGRGYLRQFWPAGAEAGAAASSAPDPQGTGAIAPAEPDDADMPPAAPAASALPDTVDETPQEARRSERALDGAARKELQRALKWEGHYGGAIDGDFGPGTRRAMAAWQAAEGHAPTGILTSAERRTLLERYRAARESLGLQIVQDLTAGIEIALPMKLLGEDGIDPPFLRYSGPEGSQIRVLLISQSGSADTLRGLYEIMQTLRIVPLDGPRSFNGRSFSLVGRDAHIISTTFARLKEGEIKGYTLVWPADDEKRMRLVLEAMRQSFRALPGAVLPDAAGSAAVPEGDLLAGLEIRRPERRRSGFFVSRAGDVLTTAEAVQGCGRITLDGETRADVAAEDAQLGAALLRPRTALAPMGIARLRKGLPGPGAEIAAAGYSFGGELGAPSLTFGRFLRAGGLRGEAALSRLELQSTAQDGGGPLLDDAGRVFGMVLPPADSGPRKLPPELRFAINGEALAAFLAGAGAASAGAGTAARPASADGGIRVSQTETGGAAALDAEDLQAIGSAMTVLVECWN